MTAKAGLAGTGFDTGVAIADYDNDGYEDIFVGGVHRNTLYHNNGNGTFTDVTAKAGLPTGPDPEYGPLWSVGGAWVDVNNDGLLDLLIVNYLQWNGDKEQICLDNNRREYCHPRFYGKTPNQLFLNNGDGTFKDVSVASGLWAHPGKGMGVGVADYDLDGRMDFFIPNDKLFNSLFHNKGGVKFDEIAFDANVALREDGTFISGMGVDFRDLDNDGYPDIALVALDNETFPIYKNTGKGDFVEVTGKSGMAELSAPMSGYSPMIADFDNDGWKDIFVSRGHVQSLLAEPRLLVAQHNTVFRNLGGMTFAALTEEAGFGRRRHRGIEAPPWATWMAMAGWILWSVRWPLRRDLDEPQSRVQSLAGAAAGRHQEQSRRDRRAYQDCHQKRRTVQSRHYQRGLCVLQRRSGAFWTGSECRRGTGGDSLAIGRRAGA